MYYTVYKITNTINDKIYIGAHKTKDLEDNYMGSGTYVTKAQNKYGIENFTKETIFRAVSYDIMYWIERMLVDEEFISLEETYNLNIGGYGGSWSNANKSKTHQSNSGKLGVAALNIKYGKCRPYSVGRKCVHSKPRDPQTFSLFNCEFCNREIKNEGNLVQHERSCKNNPNKIKAERKNRKQEEVFTCNCGREIRGKASFSSHNNKCNKK